VLIASGDTTVKAPNGTERPTALPIFLRQNSGPGLKGKGCGAKKKPGYKKHHHGGGQGEEDPALAR
jgi:hypothetical protein